MNFAVVNLGCKVNRVESDDAAAQLLSEGMQMTSEELADILVVNTCTVTGEAEKKTRKAVRHALRVNATARLVVTGCAAAIDPAAYEAMDVRVRVVPKGSLRQALHEEALVCLSARGRMAADDSDGRMDGVAGAFAGDDAGFLLRTGESFPTRVGVKVQDGCNNACTYCIVHVARGRAVSRPIGQIVAECVAYARAGVREIVLTGINLGSYRAECGDGVPVAPSPRGAGSSFVRLAGLLEELLKATEHEHVAGEAPCRFRISSIEPRDVDDALIAVLAGAQGRVCRHLHLPLQAGNDQVLREMARPYRAADYVALVDRLRAACPTLSLSTDVIVGFPGETDAQFQDTIDLAKRCGFSKMHVFPYSQRVGTPAAERADQVSAQVKAARANKLRAVAEQLRNDDYGRRAGNREQVLVEAGGRGMTESYYEVAVPADAVVGSLVDMRLPQSWQDRLSVR